MHECPLRKPLVGPVFLLAVLAFAGSGGGRAGGVSAGGSGTAERRVISLNGTWEFRRDGATEWKPVAVPSTMQSHEGNDFHGVGWYRRTLPPLPPLNGRRVWLQFDAAATLAEVWLGDQKVGRHLGGWMPFRFDLTPWLRADADAPPEIRVRLDEKAGHNTQGFLPVIEPHFGGLWQAVKLRLLPEVAVDDLSLQAYGDPRTRRLVLGVKLASGAPGRVDHARIAFRLEGARAETVVRRPWPAAAREARFTVPVAAPKFWSPAAPNRYRVRLELWSRAERLDQVATWAAFRDLRARGNHLRLNGAPLSVRGLLNWGYYPPRLAPFPDEERFRRDLLFARARGFNTMKFCLWAPPRRFLELCDELGMLAWMEYPTWHPQLTPDRLPELRREFTEFFHYDRNHPSVILRSLTCETGPGADLDVIRTLYDLAHREIPGAVVEDDSSWIGWNRVHDFYDDHPYGNNHTWVKTLAGFREYIRAHGPKPLVLGECMAADTWVERRPILDRVGDRRPYWLPRFFDDLAAWRTRWETNAGPAGLDALGPESRRYALLMRKYQIEAFRREIPYGGYVVSVIRDFPLAGMGLLDYLDQPKWPPADWAWQGDTMLLLRTENDRRSYAAGERLRADVLLSHFGTPALADAEVTVTLREAGPGGRVLQRAEQKNLRQNPGTLATVLKLDIPLPGTEAPRRLRLQARLQSPAGPCENAWSLWLLPRPRAIASRRIRLHPSLAGQPVAACFPEAARSGAPASGQVVVAARFDDALVAWLERGGRVLLLPDGQKHSFPLAAHWFLRGGPWVSGHPLARRAPRRFWIELQHFDLAGDVIPGCDHFGELDPIVMLWDTHDRRTVATHGLLFETRAGGGRLLVSALRHTDNAAGRWLLAECLDHLLNGPPPRHAMRDATWQRLKEKLHEARLDLTRRPWRFKPDPDNRGVAEHWASPALKLDDSWKKIRVGAAWEGQGYPDLDHWAWYRITVQIPESWRGRPVYLNFTGVDDMYELYLDGERIARRGDLATRRDTFSEKFSHDLTARMRPGEPHVIAVRVYDWYGAGGIFRPVSLSTVAFAPEGEWLK